MAGEIKIVPLQRAALEDQSALKIGAQSSERLRDMMNAITQQKRLPGSTLEGASRVFTGLMGAYHGGQADSKNEKLQNAIIESLEGRDMTGLERSLVAQGDKDVLKNLAGEDSGGRSRVADQATALERLREQTKAARETQAINRNANFAQAERMLRLQREMKEAEQIRQYELEYGVDLSGRGGSPAPSAAPASAPSAGVNLRPSTAPDGAPISTASVPAAPAPTEASGLRQLPPGGLRELKLQQEIEKQALIAKAKAEAKEAAAAPERERAQLAARRKWDSTYETVDRALGNIARKVAPGEGLTRYLPETSVGFIGGIQSVLGPLSSGSDFADVRATLKTIDGNFGFKELLEMKRASPNGASGLGQVTEKELALLISLNTTLDQAQGAEQFRDNLAYAKDILLRIDKGMKEDFGEVVPPEKSASSPGKTRMRYDPASGTMKPVE